MNEQETTVVHNINLNTNQPTSFTFSQLYDWVIWQFPTQIENGLSGAVRPPIADATWYPALIQPKEKCVSVYAHVNTPFNSPEEASNWFLKQPLPI